jgi:hypothetical protein
MQELAEDIDLMWISGTLAARPAASKIGREYLATDTGETFVDTGSSWIYKGRAIGSGANNVVAGNDARLTDQRVPTDSSVTNAKVAAAAAIAESKLALASDAASGTASRRTLGTGATQAAAGNDARLSDQRVPTDASVTIAKLATAVLNNFLKLATSADRKLAFGTGTSPAFDSTSGRSKVASTISHGLGLTPVFAVVVPGGIAVSEAAGQYAPGSAVTALSTTLITYLLTAPGTSNNSVTYWWAAIA